MSVLYSSTMANNDHIIAWQINLQHNITATAELMRSLDVVEQNENKPYLVFIQEPYVCHNRIHGLNSRATVFHGETPHTAPRTAIICSRKLKAWKVPEYSSRDVTTCMFQDKKGKPMYVVSAYLDCTLNHLPPELLRVTAMCLQKGHHFIVAMDTNAHSHLWGYETTNRRGEMLEDFIFHNFLSVANRGAHPTFYVQLEIPDHH